MYLMVDKRHIISCVVLVLAVLATARTVTFGQGDPAGTRTQPLPAPVVEGDRAFQARKYTAAVEAYSGVSPLDLPAVSVNRLAIAQFLTGARQDAVRLFRFGIERAPDLASLRNNLGAVLYAQGDYGDAREQILDALERYPDNGHIQSNLRFVRFAEENRREARDRQEGVDPTEWVESVVGEVIRVRSLLPEEVGTLVRDLERRGDTYLAGKMFDGAAAEYERLVRMEQENYQVIHKLGLAYHQLGDLDRAEDLYRDALDLNPYYIPSLNNLGSLEHARGRSDRAMQYFQRVLEIRPDWPMALKNVGLLLLAVERYEDGLAYLLRGLALDPSLLDQPEESGVPIVAQSTPANTAMFSYYMARVWASAGNADLTMSYLYRAVEEGVDDMDLIADPSFALLSGDERYTALIESLEAN